MENLNLVELLKDAPKGTKLYSPVCGECELVSALNDASSNAIKVRSKCNVEWSFYRKGEITQDGECLLFPSKENRDWSKFKVDDKGFSKGKYVRSKNSGGCFKIININEEIGIYSIVELVSDRKIQGDLTFSRDNFINGFEKIEKFDRSCFRPFDRVLVRDYESDRWKLGNFSHIDDSSDFKFVTFVTTTCKFMHCVPYNSDTEELLNTDDYAPEFYEEECDY